MIGDLAAMNWEEEFEGLAIDDLWLRFKDILDSLVGRYVPLVKGRRKKYPQWMTKDVIRARFLCLCQIENDVEGSGGSIEG